MIGEGFVVGGAFIMIMTLDFYMYSFLAFWLGFGLAFLHGYWVWVCILHLGSEYKTNANVWMLWLYKYPGFHCALAVSRASHAD